MNLTCVLTAVIRLTAAAFDGEGHVGNAGRKVLAPPERGEGRHFRIAPSTTAPERQTLATASARHFGRVDKSVKVRDAATRLARFCPSLLSHRAALVRTRA